VVPLAVAALEPAVVLLTVPAVEPAVVLLAVPALEPAVVLLAVPALEPAVVPSTVPAFVGCGVKAPPAIAGLVVMSKNVGQGVPSTLNMGVGLVPLLEPVLDPRGVGWGVNATPTGGAVAIMLGPEVVGSAVKTAPVPYGGMVAPALRLGDGVETVSKTGGAVESIIALKVG
jgi:hypothetical protein